MLYNTVNTCDASRRHEKKGRIDEEDCYVCDTSKSNLALVHIVSQIWRATGDEPVHLL